MLYNRINLLLNNCIKMFENIKTKILNYKKNIIKIKDTTKKNYYNYKEKLIVLLNTHYNKFYTYWWNNYDKISI